MGQRHRAGRHCTGGRARAYCLAEASPLKNIRGPGGTAGTSLHAAALSMARGVSGVWLRAVCRLGLLCRGTVYLLVGYLALRLALAAHSRAGAVGCVARAVVFVLVGVFLLKAAVLSSAKQAKGLDAVFRSVASSAYGPWLLAGLASGLLCYGLYCLLEARYRDLTPGR